MVDLTATITAGTTHCDARHPGDRAAVPDPDQDAVDIAALQRLVVNNVDDVRGDLVLPPRLAATLPSRGHPPTPLSSPRDGRVNRPAHGDPAVAVDLTATLTRGDATHGEGVPGPGARPPEAVEPEAYMFAYFTGDTIAGEKIYFGASQRQRRAQLDHPERWAAGAVVHRGHDRPA